MNTPTRRWRGWKLLGAALLLALILSGMGCAVNEGFKRSDVEEWYSDGRINRVEYEDMMQKIDAREKAEQAAAAGSTPAPAPATPATTP